LESRRVKLGAKYIKQPVIPKTDPLALYWNLYTAVAIYQDGKMKKAEQNKYHRNDRKSIRDRFGGSSTGKTKNKRIRGTVFGKRSDYTGRTVVSPDTDHHIDYIGIPMEFCRHLTIDETVQDYNVIWLTQLVRRGPHNYPGALYMERDGSEIDLSMRDDLERANIVLQNGDKIKRQLIKGDWVVANRQPTIHRPSIKAFRVRPLPEGRKSMEVHVATAESFNMDFDGDEATLWVQQGIHARAEAQVLLSPSHNVVMDGKPSVSFIQYTILGAWHLSDPETVLPAEWVRDLWMLGDFTHDPWPFGDRSSITGVEFLKALYFTQTGRLDKGKMHHQVLDWYRLYGSRRTADLISRSYCVLHGYMYRYRGNTVKLRDLHTTINRDVVGNAQRHVAQHGMNEELMDALRDTVAHRVLSILKPQKDNGLMALVQSRAKGNLDNIVSMTGMLGVHHDQDGPIRMIYDNYYDGLSMQSYFTHVAAARKGLVDTAVNTKESGQKSRWIMKTMELIHSNPWGHVEHENRGVTIQYRYGGDGWDPSYLSRIYLPYLARPPPWDRYRYLWERMEHNDEGILAPIDPFILTGGKPPNALTDEAFRLMERYSPKFQLAVTYFGYTPETLRRLELSCDKARITPNEMVGHVGGQAMGQKILQTTLNTFHHVGKKHDIVTGIPRLKELLHATDHPLNPISYLPLKPGCDGSQLAESFLRDVVVDSVGELSEDGKSLHFALKEALPEPWRKQQNRTHLVVNSVAGGISLRMMAEKLLSTRIGGVPGILEYDTETNEAVGSNLFDALRHPDVDATRAITSHVKEVEAVLGLFAARRVLAEELSKVFGSQDGMQRHILLLSDQMTHSGSILSASYSGRSKDSEDSLLRTMSLEHSMQQFHEAALQRTVDQCTSMSACIVVGRPYRTGTSSVKFIEKPREEILFQLDAPKPVIPPPPVSETWLADMLGDARPKKRQRLR